jgi:hypothetical protein
MDNFTAPEEDSNLALVAIGKKTTDVLELCLIVVLIGLGTEFYFFDLDYSLLFLRFLFTFLLLIRELTIVHDFAYRRICLLGNLNQVKTFFPCDFKGLMSWKNSQLITLIIYNPDLRNSNTLVSAGTVIPAIRAPTISIKRYSSCLRV